MLVRPRNPQTASVRLTPRLWPPRNKGNGKTHFPAIRLAGLAEGLPHLVASMLVLPVIEGTQVHNHATWRLRSAYNPVPTRTHRNRWSTSDIRRLQILPYGSRSLYTLAGGHSPSGHYGGDGCPSTAVRMVIFVTDAHNPSPPTRACNSNGSPSILWPACAASNSRMTDFHPAANGLVERMNFHSRPP
jgi:hypothetical protein